MYETRVTSQKINYAHPPCPISAALLARIIEADRRGRRALARSVPDERRAELALFLYDDPDLQRVAVDIAPLCDALIIIRKAGSRGIALLAAAEERPPIRRSSHR
jgi:hypothetical protein